MSGKNVKLIAALLVGTLALVTLLIGLGGLPDALARTITVDGDDDWDDTGREMDAPDQDNLGQIVRNSRWEGEYVWTDKAGDERTDFASPDKNADLVQFRITGDRDSLYFFAKMNDITIGSGDGAPMIQVAIDTDREINGGEVWFAGNADTKVYSSTSASARWEYLLTTRFGSGNDDVRIYTATATGSTWTPTYTGSASISTTTEIIEFSVPWTSLGMSGPPTLPLRFTVAVFRAAVNDDTRNISGSSDALDAITNYGDPGSTSNTWDEVSDGIVDYYFDLFFQHDGDVYPPLLISEVLYDPSGSEPGAEFIEIYNISPITLDLGVSATGRTFKVGDEETIDDSGSESMAEFKFGTAIGSREVKVIAHNGSTFESTYGSLPDFEFEWASDAANMYRYNEWDGDSITGIILGNDGDQVLLLDPSDTVLDVVTYEGSVATWPGVDGGNSGVSNASLERYPAGVDTNYCYGGDFRREPGTDGDPGVVRDIDISIGKTAAPLSIGYRDEVTYTVILNNSGSADATDTYFTDTLSTLVTFTRWVQQPAGAVYNTGIITWNGTLTASSSITFTYVVTNYSHGVTVTNEARYLFTDQEGSVSFSLYPPQLSISKAVTPSTDVPYHEEVTYTLILTNTGNLHAEDTLFTDTLPAAVDFLRWVEQPTGALESNDVITWSGTVAGQSTVTFTFVVTHVGGYGETVTNTAEYGHTTGGGSGQAAFTVANPALSLNKTANPANIPYHGEVTYTVKLANGGISRADDTLFTDTLPAAVDFLRWVEQPTGALVSNDVITWSGTVTAQDAVTFTFVVTHVGGYGETVTNTAEYSHATGSGSGQATFTVAPATPSLSIGKQATPDTDVAYHGSVTYTVTLENSGMADATGVLFTDTLPAAVDFLRWVEQPTGALESNDVITWSGTVAGQSTVTFTFVVTHVGGYGETVTNTAEYSHTTGGGSGQAAFTVANPALSLNKTANPANIPYHGEVTYTVKLANGGISRADDTLFTDTLPAAVDFLRWVEQPTGALESNDVITWSGTVAGQSTVTFTFVVTHVGGYGETVTNTAEYSHTTGGGSGQATFTVEQLYDITFVYHDQEDVVHSGEAVYLAGNFNDWDSSALSLTADAAYETFSATVSLTRGDYEYKYIVYTDTALTGPARWDWLNTSNRSYAVATADIVDDYRDVVVGWANLQYPPSVETTLGEDSGHIFGRVYIQGVTVLDVEGRSIAAQLGYGTDTDPANWTWSPMDYNPYCTSCGNNDEFMGVITPTATGVYSYATRFDGNWGAGNPNSGWTYGDTNGAPPFSIQNTGVMTVYRGPHLVLTKTVSPAAGVPRGSNVTYTIKLVNSGDRPASTVLVSDVLPGEVTSNTWIISPTGTVQNGDTITWTGDLLSSEIISWQFTAFVTGTYGASVVNTATVEYNNVQTDSVATFTFEPLIPPIVINELDADQTGTDAAEFVELYDGGSGGTSLDGLVLVFFNGLGDASYEAYDLDGYSTDSSGYFVLCGNKANVSNCDREVTPDTNLIQNGADAVALYVGDDTDFPNGTSVTADNLVDAIVYDTDDSDDYALLALLNTGQPQVNENGRGQKDTDSNQRCPNGSGGRRNTDTYIQAAPTPGVTNHCESSLAVSKTATPDVAVPIGGPVTYTIVVENNGVGDEPQAHLTDTLPVSTTFSRWVEQSGAMESSGVITWQGSITTGHSVTIAFVVTNNGDYEESITNTAAVSGTYNYITDTASFTVISPYPELVVSKSGPEYAVIGGQVVYQIGLSNQGAVSATNVILTDTLPVSVTYDADDSGLTARLSTIGDHRVITWAVGDLPESTSLDFNLTTTVHVSVTGGTILTNTLAVSRAGANDDPADNTAQWETTVYPLVPIHDVQYVTDPASNDGSPYSGQTVWVEGIVVAGTGEIGYSGNNFVIEEPDGGPWSGLMVYNGSSFPDVNEGDYVRLLGSVTEYNGMTELSIRNEPHAQEVISTGRTLPAPQVIATGNFVDAGTAEQWESVLLEFQKALVTDEELGFGEWAFDDGSGVTRADDFGENDGDLTYTPNLNDYYGYIRGVGWYSYGEYKLEPRYDADIFLRPHVIATDPADGATNVQLDTDIRATFNMTVTNVDGDTFTVEGPGGPVSGTVSYEDATNIATFTPDSDLTPGTTYTATLSGSIQETGGVTMSEDYVWHFATVGAGLTVQKTGPDAVLQGDPITYAITVQNQTGLDLTNLIITDAVPAGTTFAYALDGGTESSGVVSWTASSLNNHGLLTVRFVVTATTATTVTNEEYYAWATNWLTHETGLPVTTTVTGLLTPIGTARTKTGETVTVVGRATMYTGGFYAGSGVKFYVQDATGGIAVYCIGDNLPDVTLGDLVTVTGSVDTYRNEVRIQPNDGSDVIVVDGSPADVPAPLHKAVSEVDNDNDALGWLVMLRGQATRVDEYTYSYQIDIGDGQGKSTALIYVDKNTGIDISNVQVGHFYVITGIAEIYNTTYEVKPRIQADISEYTPPTLQIRKDGPDVVLQNQIYTYTLTAANNTTATLHDLVITDTVPANATLAFIGDGGVAVGNTVSWTLGSLVAGDEWTVHFAVTATGSVGSLITNDSFAVWASNWPTHETGTAVETEISSGCPANYIHTYAIQGSGDTTPYSGQVITTCGVVVGVSDRLRGLFIQDVNGDGDAATSDGLFVYRGNLGVSGVSVGDLVVVEGMATEYYSCTQVSASQSSDVLNVVANDRPLPEAVELNPPADRSDADAYLEPFEGMLVEVPVTATVVGPTNKYGETYVVRGDTGLDRLVLQTNPPDGYRLGMDDGIVDTGSFKVGDVIAGVFGPLHFTYSNWKVEQWTAPTLVSASSLPDFPSYASPADDQFTVAAFNLLNFDGEDDPVKLNKVADAIEALGGPTFLSLEEIATLQTCTNYDNETVTGVITDLITALEAKGYHYAYLASHPDVGCHGVALLYDANRVQMDGWTTLQACASYGSSSAATYDPINCSSGEYPLFSRRPVVMTGTLTYNGAQRRVVFIANHFKSKGTSSTCVLPECADRRLAQAELVANYAASLMDTVDYVAVAGDLNDFLGSTPLNALYSTGNLTNTFYILPAEERYSYVYNGMSEVLDHILISAPLWDNMLNFVPVHINADYPAAWETAVISYGVSDHDPVLAYFDLATVPASLSVNKTVEPTANVELGAVVTYTIVISNGGEETANGVLLTDTLPAGVTFNHWVEQGSAVLPPPDENTVSWGPWSVAGGTEYTIRFTALVTTDTNSYGQTIVNTVVYTSDGGSGSASASFTIEAAPQQPALAIAKTVAVAHDPVHLGDPVTYTVIITNSGNGDAVGVVVTDTLPAGVSGRGIGEAVTVTAGGQVEFTIPVTVTADPAFYGQTVTNTAYFAHESGRGSASASFTIEEAPPYPVLTITKTVATAHDPVHLGDPVTYTVIIANFGGGDAVGVVVTDTLPAGVSGRGIGEAVTVTAGGQVEFTIPVTVTADPAFYGRTVTNTAYFAHEGNTGSAAAAFTIESAPPPPVLTITKTVATAHDPVRLGDPVTYTVIIANSGGSDAVGVVVTDTLPAGVSGSGIGEAVTVTAGGQVEFTIPVTVAADPAFYGQTVTNTAYFAHESGRGSASASFTIEEAPPYPVLTITKTVATVHDPVHLGDPVTYTVIIANFGGGDAVGVVVTDTLPAGVSGSGIGEAVTVTAGGQVEFTIPVTVTADPAFYDRTIVNTAYFAYEGEGGSAMAAFTIMSPYRIFMPIIVRNG